MRYGEGGRWLVRGSDPVVVFSLLRRPLPGGLLPRSRYELVRQEAGAPAEMLAQGEGLAGRWLILTFLREVAELDGPDAPAAIAALKGGWTTVPVPPAPEPGP